MGGDRFQVGLKVFPVVEAPSAPGPPADVVVHGNDPRPAAERLPQVGEQFPGVVDAKLALPEVDALHGHDGQEEPVLGRGLIIGDDVRSLIIIYVRPAPGQKAGVGQRLLSLRLRAGPARIGVRHRLQPQTLHHLEVEPERVVGLGVAEGVVVDVPVAVPEEAEAVVGERQPILDLLVGQRFVQVAGHGVRDQPGQVMLDPIGQPVLVALGHHLVIERQPQFLRPFVHLVGSYRHAVVGDRDRRGVVVEPLGDGWRGRRRGGRPAGRELGRPQRLAAGGAILAGADGGGFIGGERHHRPAAFACRPAVLAQVEVQIGSSSPPAPEVDEEPRLCGCRRARLLQVDQRVAAQMHGEAAARGRLGQRHLPELPAARRDLAGVDAGDGELGQRAHRHAVTAAAQSLVVKVEVQAVKPMAGGEVAAAGRDDVEKEPRRSVGGPAPGLGVDQPAGGGVQVHRELRLLADAGALQQQARDAVHAGRPGRRAAPQQDVKFRFGSGFRWSRSRVRRLHEVRLLIRQQ